MLIRVNHQPSHMRKTFFAQTSPRNQQQVILVVAPKETHGTSNLVVNSNLYNAGEMDQKESCRSSAMIRYR
jgi:hypothetical protein